MIFVLPSRQPERVKWFFPPTRGGVSQGFNDSGKEFFTAGILEHVVREIIQNSLDAKNPKYPDRPVVVRMERIDLERTVINASDLAKHVKESLKCTIEQRSEKGTKFYREALKILKKAKIPVLRVIDESTTGLNGTKWDALVYKEGTPSKDTAAAGGSYGIGKNAPYAASELGLVCYSTRYLDRHRTEKFIARCKLVAHGNPTNSDEELQHVGFGTSNDFDGKHYPPIMADGMHEEFRLQKNGTGIFIIGFQGRDWEKITRRSIACNFFAAIHDKNLVVQVGNTHITNETLNGEDFGDEKQKHYYDLYKNSDKPITISGEFGMFSLKISMGGDSMENRVAYVNRRGMLITAEKTFNKNPFSARIEIGKYSAVVWATDDKSDIRVRAMEPPTHESIEYKRITDLDECQKTKRELQNIADKIRDHIKKKLNFDAFEQKTELTELADIIPFVSDPDKNNKTDERNGKTSMLNEQIGVKKRPIKGNITSIGNEKDGAGTGSGTDSGTVSGRSKSKNKKDKKRGTTANMKNVRLVRHGDALRVAFTPKTGANKFSIRPAGEEDKEEDPIRITRVEDMRSSAESVNILDNVITVNADKDARVVLDVPLGQSLQYTGYSIVEYRARRKKA